MKTNEKRWKAWKHVLVFAVGTIAGSFLFVLFAPIMEWLNITPLNEEQSIFRYGGTALLLNCLFAGTLFFTIGAVIATLFLSEPVLWPSAVTGILYSVVIFLAAPYIPIEGESLSTIMYFLWWKLFPVFGLVVSCLLFKCSNKSLKPGTPQSGAP